MFDDVPPQPLDERDQSLLTAPFAVVMLAAFAYFVAIGALVPTVPRFIERELDGDGLAVGVGVGSMAVTAALLRPWVGRMGDRHGRRVLAVAGAAVVAVSILLYAAATELWILVLARLLTGAGEAAMFVGVATAAQDLAPDHRRGEAASYFSIALYGGLAVGPPIGEALVEHGFTTVWLVLAGSSALAALAAVWIPRGRTVADPPRRSVLQPDAVWPGVILFLGLVPFIAFSSFVPLYAEELGQESVGGVLGLYAGLVLVVRIVGARLPDRLGWRRGSTIALVAVAVGVSLVAAWGTMAAIWFAAVALAVGMSLLYPSLFTAVMAAAPESERTHAVGTFSVFFDLSTALGATMVGLVVSLAGERGGFGAAGALALVGLGAQWLLRDRIGRRRLQPVEGAGGDLAA
ncbi:MAG TPA: MFS transporter [Acidimicrobiales bacterium]|nr:MFS transporter [Acidimicrobiales bacterium]